jgi:hypothetical protein
LKATAPPKTTATQRALRCLHTSGYNGLSSGEVGGAVWPDRTIRGGRGVSSNGGGDYAAQMLLGRLKKAGLVEYAPSEGSTRWRLSTKGQKAVGRLPSAPTSAKAQVAKAQVAKAKDAKAKDAKAKDAKAKDAKAKDAKPIPKTGGAIVTDIDPCVCGGAPEDHGRDPEYPGSTACTHCTDCVAYEADPGAE